MTTPTPATGAAAELPVPPLFKSMLDGYYAKVKAGFEVEKILGWEWDSIAGLEFDWYDESFEIYAPEDCIDAAPTKEQHAAIMALGCRQYWINFTDGTERFCTGNRKQGNSRWHKFDEGERLERRAVLTTHAPAQSQLDALREEVARLKAAAQESALQHLSDSGQWIEEVARLTKGRDEAYRQGLMTGLSDVSKLRAELAALKAQPTDVATSQPDEARDAARYRWLRSFATPGQRPAKEDMPMGYREIRLRVDTPVYMPAHWANDVDRAIDAAMSKEQP